MAGTISYTEGSGGQPANFALTAPGTALAAATNPGTTIVNGTVSGNFTLDWFELTGLGSGTFTAGATTDGTFGDQIFIFDPANLGVPLESRTFTNTEAASFGSLSIPGSGNLAIEIQTVNESSNGYTVTVNTTGGAVPEPGTIGLVGVGLAGALTLARKRRKQ
jgi:hypothetical protein